MKIRGLAGILACCAALAVAGCTTTAIKAPDTNVTPPSVGSPPPPSSVSAAEQSEPFTPYEDLGVTNDDGLAPNESATTLTTGCMAAAGYGSDASDVATPYFFGGGLSRSVAYGAWGFLGTAQAAQSGFFGTQGIFGAGAIAIGSGGVVAESLTPSSDLSGAAQKAAGKCSNIILKFSNAEQTGPLSQIQTLSGDITSDVQHDAAVKKATKAWSACLATNGYNITDPATAFIQAIRSMAGSGDLKLGSSSATSSPQYRAQIAIAETDADCTQSTDLAGIYFAVQAGYEQQFVNLNQVQLSAAVSEYRAAYEKEAAELPKLLLTAPSNSPFRFVQVKKRS